MQVILLERIRALGQMGDVVTVKDLSLIHISEPTRLGMLSRMPSSA